VDEIPVTSADQITWGIPGESADRAGYAFDDSIAADKFKEVEAMIHQKQEPRLSLRLRPRGNSSCRHT